MLSKEYYRSQVGAQAQNNWATRQGEMTAIMEKFGTKDKKTSIIRIRQGHCKTSQRLICCE